MVQSVLTSLFPYWANIFLVPKGVLRKTDSICRNYLWVGTSNYIRTPLVSWEQVCTPKSEGGLGIKHSFTWNMATVGKLVGWIYSKPHSLWVKWVHQIYMKGSSWSDHIPKANMSGNWKAICKVRDILQDGYANGSWLDDQKGYSVKSGYEWLRTKSRRWVGLSWFGIVVPETVVHLFQQCKYTQLVLIDICYWLHISYPEGNGIVWIGRRKWTVVQKSSCLAAFMVVYYEVWHQRNATRLEGMVCRPKVLSKKVQSIIRCRLRLLNVETLSLRNRDWINSLV
ncbi:uncharacterized protein LOC141629590 [Silene latifolia]|uniref:uncharacterized protein LOC141629590 n=1 Tax=Silene latifolia TaxID=37657 RepID=UPI003D7853C4